MSDSTFHTDDAANLKRAAPQDQEASQDVQMSSTSGGRRKRLDTSSSDTTQKSNTETAQSPKLVSLSSLQTSGSGGIPPLKESRGPKPAQKRAKVHESERELLKMLIPSKLAGTVIGLKGSTIEYLRSSSRATIHMNNPHDDAERVLEVGGSVPEVEIAVRMILSQLYHHEISKTKSTDEPIGKAPLLTDDVEVELKFLVPNNKVGGLIGAKGSSIEEIRRTCNTQISIPSNHAVPTGALDRSVTVVGPLGATLQTLKKILSKLQTVRPSGYTGGPPSTRHSQHGVTNLQPAIVGFNTHVISNSPVNAHPNMLQPSITASQLGYTVTAAQQLQPVALNAALTGAETVSVDDKYMGKVMGAKGRTIGEIRRQSRCKIEIHDKDSSGTRLITLSGSVQQRETAKELIRSNMC